ncbi:MAG: leucyl/phenylalanyl-tRNA--protein transferase [Planctomycetota bacterium]
MPAGLPDFLRDPEAPEALIGVPLERNWILHAYTRGYFPWPDPDGKVVWYNPPERMVFDPAAWRAPRRLLRTLRSHEFQVRLDGDFEAVVRGCATVGREDGTWITEDMQHAYLDLFHLGFAHCVEVLQGGRLVGGLYGLALGGMFFGESMFSTVSNGSKIAFSVLLAHLEREGFDLFDAQVHNNHLERLGGTLWDRDRYLRLLRASLTRETHPGRWTLPPDLAAGRGLPGPLPVGPGSRYTGGEPSGS